MASTGQFKFQNSHILKAHMCIMFHIVQPIKASVGLHDGEYGFSIYLGDGFQLQWWLFVPSQWIPGGVGFKTFDLSLTPLA